MYNLVPITSVHSLYMHTEESGIIVSLVPGAQKQHLVHTDALLVFKNGIANVYDIYTIYGCMLGRNSSSKHPLVGQCKRHKRERCHFFREMAWVCRLCGSSVAYSHHRVCSIGKKASQED